MSNIFLGKVDVKLSSVVERSLCHVPHAASWLHTTGPLAVITTRVDDGALWGPARDPESGVYVALGGRLAFPEDEWRRAESMPFEGGLVCRLVLEAFLSEGRVNASRWNGAGSLIIWDPRAQEIHVITDRMGVFPLFRVRGKEPLLCSHPDVLADTHAASGGQVTFDRTTAAEFLATGRSVQPYTYYEEIKTLQPATHYRWHLTSSGWEHESRIYWHPCFYDEEPCIPEAVLIEELAAALASAVKLRTNPRLGRPAVLLSGGADSRVCLFGARNPPDVLCYTLYDEENEELATARRLAAAAGASHQALQRSQDYYMENAERSLKIAGGMWSLIDAHYTGIIDSFQGTRIGTILTGCYADYLFKGLDLNRRYRRLLGKTIPVFELAPFNHSFYQHHIPISACWQEKVRNRLEGSVPPQWRDSAPRSRLIVGDIRNRPFAHEADFSGRSTLWRTLPWDHVFSDLGVLGVWERMSARQKLNGIVFGKAVSKACGKAASGIPNNNYNAPVGASETVRVACFLTGVMKRKVEKVLGFAPKRRASTSTGSWPNWADYLRSSPLAADLWSSVTSCEREQFINWLGTDPFVKSIQTYSAADALVAARIFSLLLVLRNQALVR